MSRINLKVVSLLIVASMMVVMPVTQVNQYSGDHSISTDILIMQVGSSNYPMQLAYDTLINNLSVLSSKQNMNNQNMDLSLVTKVMEAQSITQLQITSVTTSVAEFGKTLANYNAKLVIVVAHGTPEGIVDIRNQNVLSWDSVGNTLVSNNIQNVAFATCFSSKVKDYVPNAITYDSYVDGEFAGLQIASSVLYSMYGQNSMQFKSVYLELSSLANSILKGERSIYALAPVRVSFSIYIAGPWWAPYLALSISITYNTVAFLLNLAAGAVAFAYSLFFGGMTTYGFIYSVIGFILRLVDFGWWWSALVVPLIQVALTAVVLYFFGGITTVLDQAIRSSGYSLYSLFAATMLAYTFSNILISLFKYTMKAILGLFGLSGSTTNYAIDAIGYRITGPLRNFLYDNWGTDGALKKVMGQIFKGLPWWMQIILKIVQDGIDYYVWSYFPYNTGGLYFTLSI